MGLSLLGSNRSLLTFLFFSSLTCLPSFCSSLCSFYEISCCYCYILLSINSSSSLIFLFSSSFYLVLSSTWRFNSS